jgi:hypothetical protein
METTTIDRAESLRAYPTLSAAARMLGVAPSTLTRREDVESLARGSRDLVLAPGEVLRLATVYRKRSLNEVAADLIALAGSHGTEDAARVEEAVEAFFAGRTSQDSRGEFLAQAKQHLPDELYEQVERAVLKSEGRPPADVTGHTPERPGKQAAPAKSAAPRQSRAPKRASKDAQRTPDVADASPARRSRKRKLAEVGP